MKLLFQVMGCGCHGVLGVHVQRLVVIAHLPVNDSVTHHDMVDNLVKVWQRKSKHA